MTRGAKEDAKPSGGATVIPLATAAYSAARDLAHGGFASDAELIDGLRHREPAATRALYARAGQKINRLVARLLGADQEHNDVVQQVFVNILSAVGKLRNPQLFEAWLSAVTINTVRNEIRSRTYRRRFTLAPDPAGGLAGRLGAEERLYIQHLYAVLRQLDADERILFVLHYMEGYSLAEMAEQGGYSVATAKRKLARARAAFEVAALGDPVLASFVQRGGGDAAP